ncbi:sensor histidine kinase [Cohnella mopanensis]|uniref:sensor histidine kinase n=1 Tax=Cohnella mopanensis TaxID=2911966 RepID=UPI001EF82B03|nr:sensor histidine kinase [Cohnella mopanensis]
MFPRLALLSGMNRISLKYRLLLYFLMLVILPTTIISVTIYNQSYHTITENINTSVQTNLNMVEMVLLKKIEEMDEAANSIYLNPDMIDRLSSDRPSDQVDFVNELATLNKIIDGYDLPNRSGSRFIPTLYMLNRPEYTQYNFSRNVGSTSEIEDEKWYAKLPPKAQYTISSLQAPSKAGGSGYSIRLAKRLFGLKNVTIPFVGVLTIDVDISEFAGMLDQLKPSVNSSVMILDGQANVLVSPDLSMIGRSIASAPYVHDIIRGVGQTGTFEQSISGKEMLVSYREIGSLGWTVVSMSPVGDLNGKLIAFRRTMYIVLVLCMVIAALIAVLLSNNITNPIRKFIKSMSYAQEGNYDIQIQYKRKDEFTQLFSQYNVMLKQTKELIKRLYFSENKKKEAELQALQAQINPHFLYNTLDSINWIALRHNVPDVSHMVTSLSDFFRYSLNKGKNIISIEDEIRQAESYLSIQKIRFNDRLGYEIHAEPEVYGYQAVKLILQPLVENALIHGIERRPGNGYIAITATKRGDRIEIDIEDNGVGADSEKLNAMLRDEGNQDKTFGIFNVDQRIKQVFGPEFGIEYRNKDEPGLIVTVTLPATTTLVEAKDFAENDHSR